MKIAIVMPTYYREDSKSFELVNKALQSIKCQSHKDWHLFLIGDKYENKKEFKQLSNVLKDKCTSINLPIAKEREKYTNNKLALWNTGGVNANNVGIEIALLCGFDYIAHLDHDDEWNENHLEEINKCIEINNPMFICTKANYIDNKVLPTINSDKKYIDYLPKIGEQIHSSICVNFRMLKTRYIDYFELTNEIKPSDGILANDLSDEVILNGYNSICINMVTVNHIEEATIFMSNN